MKEVLREITVKAIDELGDHVLGCVIIGGFARGRQGDIDVVVIVDTKEIIEKVKGLQEKLERNYDLHPTTLETFEDKLFL
jgi:predicted nucleotidyltransferase